MSENVSLHKYSYPWVARGKPLNSAHRPLISVVLPVYNHADFVREAADSVFKASRGPLELIIVNDGSTDGTTLELEKLKQERRDPSLLVIEQKNMGLAGALNSGFSRVSGSLVTWTSADNRFFPGALDRLADFLTVNPLVALAYGNVQLFDEDGKKVRNSAYRLTDQSARDSSILELPFQAETLLSFSDNFVNACFLFRRDTLELIGLHQAAYKDFEDYDFWLRILASSYIAHVDDLAPLYRYRLHENSLTAKLDAKTVQEKQREVQINWQKVRDAARPPLELALISSQEFLSPAFARLFAAAGYNLRIEQSTASDADLELACCDYDSLPPCGKALLYVSEEGCSCACRFLQSFLSPLPFPVFAVKDKSPRNNLFLFPALELSPMLKRARDSSFRAVTGAKGSKLTVLVFPPDEVEEDSLAEQVRRSARVREKLKELVSSAPEVTFVLYCGTKQARKAADLLNLSLARNDNLRIIDACASPSGAAEPLMYALSSVDLILSLKPGVMDISAAVELRVEAGLAAASGRPLLVLTEHEPGSAGYEEAFNPRAALAARLEQPGPLLPLMPHSTFCPWEMGKISFGSKAAKSVDEMKSLDFRALDQWILNESPQRAAERLVFLLFA